jgi:hypothetical protein
MKTTILSLFLLTVSLAAARAQDIAIPVSPIAGYPVAVPSVVYQMPVVYNAPVVYQVPVVYMAPVYYGAPAVAACPAPACAPIACAPAPCQERAPRSTVLYIGGGSVRYQVSQPSCGSTVTYIGGH